MLKTRAIVKDRSISSYGQYKGIYGQGDRDFIYGADALSQILTHQILSIRGEITNRVNFGVDWFINYTPTTKKFVLDTQIKEIIRNNYYVNNILSFKSTYDVKNNIYTVQTKLDTTEGLLMITI